MATTLQQPLKWLGLFLGYSFPKMKFAVGENDNEGNLYLTFAVLFNTPITLYFYY